MVTYMHKRRSGLTHRIISSIIAFAFLFSFAIPPNYAQSTQSILNLPAPGTMVSASPGYTPCLIKGITVDLKNPLAFDFIVDTGGADFTEIQHGE